MVRNRIRALMVLLATLATAATMLTTAPPANAAVTNSGHLCETFGTHQYCLGSNNLHLFTTVTERHPGRIIQAVRQGTRTFRSLPVYKLRFAANTTRCVAAANDNFHVKIHACNQGGVDWALDKLSSARLGWINVRATTQRSSGENQFLTGHDNGTPYLIQRLVHGQVDFEFL